MVRLFIKDEGGELPEPPVEFRLEHDEDDPENLLLIAHNMLDPGKADYAVAELTKEGYLKRIVDLADLLGLKTDRAGRIVVMDD